MIYYYDALSSIEIITRVSLGIGSIMYWELKIVLCEPLASIIHYFLFPIHDTADTQRHEGNNLFII